MSDLELRKSSTPVHILECTCARTQLHTNAAMTSSVSLQKCQMYFAVTRSVRGFDVYRAGSTKTRYVPSASWKAAYRLMMLSCCMRECSLISLSTCSALICSALQRITENRLEPSMSIILSFAPLIRLQTPNCIPGWGNFDTSVLATFSLTASTLNGQGSKRLCRGTWRTAIHYYRRMSSTR